MIAEIVATVITIVMVIFKFLTWNYDHWKERGVPHIKGKVPFGNVAEVFFYKKIIGDLYSEIYRLFPNSPVCGFFKMRQPVLMIRDPELIKTVLIKEFHNFHDNDFHCDPKTDPVLAFNPFVVRGDRWKEVRGVLAPAQTPAKLKTLVPSTMKVCKNMIEFLKKNKNKDLEMLEVLGHFTTDLTAAWGLGVDVNSFENPNTDFRRTAGYAFGGDFSSNLAIQLGFYAPKLGKLIGFRMIRKQFEDYFKGVIDEVIKGREAEKTPRTDLIQMLLDMNKDAKLKGNRKEMDLQEISGHVLTFFSEGYLTSSITLSHILFELAQHQDIQDRAREEIKAVALKIDEITNECIQEAGYLDQIIDETLRLHSTVPVMTRICTAETKIDLGGGKVLLLEPGLPVTIPVQAIHRDPKYYENPDEFDPDRFSEDNKLARKALVYLGFSDGPRVCVGLKIARTNLKLAMASILLNFKITPSEKTKKIESDPLSSFILTPKNGCWVKFEEI